MTDTVNCTDSTKKDSKKKIAIFHNFMDNIGGAEIVAFTMSRSLDADIYTTNIDEEKIKMMGFGDVLPRIKSIGKIPIKAPYRQESAYWKFRMLNVEKKFGIQYDFYIIAGDWAVGGVVHNKPNLWYISSPIREIYDLQEYTRNNSVPFILRPIFDIWAWYHRLLMKFDVKNVNKFIVNSKNVQDRVKKYLNTDSTIIHPPTDTLKYKSGNMGDYWLSVNRFIPHKRIEIQMEAFTKIPDEKLVMVASYEKGARQFEEYKKKIEKMKPDNVVIKNWVDQDELINLYANCKGFITTAMDEDFGMTPVEAMASGKPVIAVNEGGYRETVVDTVTGRLIEANADSLINAIHELCDQNKTYTEQSLQKAKEFDVSIFIHKIKSFTD